MPHVCIATRSFASSAPEAWEVLERAGCEVAVVDPGPGVLERLREAIPDADGLIVGQMPIGDDVLAAAPRLRVIAVHGIGVDGIDLEAARRRGIAVANVPGANHESVADLTLGLLIALARRLIEASRATAEGGWEPFVGIELAGRTLGIVGLGRIGRAVARRAAAFGMNVIAYDPFVAGTAAGPTSSRARSAAGPTSSPTEPAGGGPTLDPAVELVGLDELLARSDAVTLHAPADPARGPLIGAAELARMKDGAFLINTARGALVDEVALYEMLESGRLGGAALDTFAVEPPVGSPLLAHPRVIATPHMAGHTHEGIARLSVTAARSVVAVLEGREPPHPVVMP